MVANKQTTSGGGGGCGGVCVSFLPQTLNNCIFLTIRYILPKVLNKLRLYGWYLHAIPSIHYPFLYLNWVDELTI